MLQYCFFSGKIQPFAKIYRIKCIEMKNAKIQREIVVIFEDKYIMSKKVIVRFLFRVKTKFGEVSTTPHSPYPFSLEQFQSNTNNFSHLFPLLICRSRAGHRRCGPSAILCKTCSVLLCILEQPRVHSHSSSAGPS